METTQLTTLLQQVTTLNNHYKKISDLTGENFNIFRILKLEASEVRLHSAFLAELLDPKGKHGQKDVFLKLFVELFCYNNKLIDTGNCSVDVEKHTTSINQGFTEGGRIDILIADKNGHQIIIENKIYAGDQKNQLLRYHNYSPDADLLYITLDQKEPDKNSIGTLIKDEHFKCYSYKLHILKWLEQCRKEVAVYPIVRESITQYINLIKYLTNQTINHSMQTELNGIIAANLEASFLIANNLNKALDEVSLDFGSKIKQQYEELGFLCDYTIDLNKRHTGIWIFRSDWKNVRIGFVFENYNEKLIYGLAAYKEFTDFPISLELRKKLSSFPNNTNGGTERWPWYRSFESPYNDWRNLETWQAIKDGTMMKLIKEKVDLLLELTAGMEL